MLSYAGIGSRETPADVLVTMRVMAEQLARRGWLLRTGGADGADTAFADGVPLETQDEMTRIYLPWRGYNGLGGARTTTLDRVQQAEAMELVAKHHPAWHRCRDGARKLHARNAAIIHGENLNDPVNAVICWTRNAVPVGGTATGIHMATDAGIPVFNLARYSGDEVLEALSLVEGEAPADHVG